jgi:hypothetical protein
MLLLLLRLMSHLLRLLAHLRLLLLEAHVPCQCCHWHGRQQASDGTHLGCCWNGLQLRKQTAA